jgi:hypothetical protein
MSHLYHGYPIAVAVSEDYAYVTDSLNGLFYIVNVTNKRDPEIVGVPMDNFFNPQGIAISGNYVYVADNTEGLVVIDVSDITRPEIVERITSGYEGGGGFLDVAVSENYAYVAAYCSFQIFGKD